jgi:hypothetical protein
MNLHGPACQPAGLFLQKMAADTGCRHSTETGRRSCGWDLTKGELLFIFAASSAVTACDISREGSVAVAAEISGRVHTFVVLERAQS